MASIAEIAKASQEAVWATVAAPIPGAVSGDLDPAEAAGFESACRAAVQAWTAANVPEASRS